LVLAAELSLDGFHVGAQASDEELARYQRRVVQKAGVHVRAPELGIAEIVALLSEGGEEELAPVVVEGDPELCRELVGRDLVDEYRLTVHPFVLGEGERLFTGAARLLNLSTRLFAQGQVAYTLVPEDKYRDHPPPYPWSTSGSGSGSAGPQGAGHDDDDPESQDTPESPAPG
jgi:hypothetical protein